MAEHKEGEMLRILGCADGNPNHVGRIGNVRAFPDGRVLIGFPDNPNDKYLAYEVIDPSVGNPHNDQPARFEVERLIAERQRGQASRDALDAEHAQRVAELEAEIEELRAAQQGTLPMAPDPDRSEHYDEDTDDWSADDETVTCETEVGWDLHFGARLTFSDGVLDGTGLHYELHIGPDMPQAGVIRKAVSGMQLRQYADWLRGLAGTKGR